MRRVYVIGGCNGAGKTTASFTLLPDMLHCKEFVNADSIASGISPFQPDKVAFEAGRVMLERIRQLMKGKSSFAFETTLSTKSYKNILKECKSKGYEVVMIYFWLNSPELAIERIKERVKKGGHHIPDNVVRRRYKRGLQNLFQIFIPVSDYWLVINNSLAEPSIIAEGNKNIDKFVYDEVLWQHIKSLK